MFESKSVSWTKAAKRGTALAALAVILLSSSASADADDRCRTLHGHLADHLLAGPTCTSTLGLCTQGTFSGGLRGEFIGIATSVIPTADTPTTAVLFATGDVIIHAHIGNREGDLTVKDAGLFHTSGKHEFSDLMSILSGTRSLTGISGVIRINGNSDPTTGTDQGDYVAEVCIP
jgi:hypothetical protein